MGIPESTMMADAKSDDPQVCWQEFFKATAQSDPRDLLVQALDMNPTPGQALELGCGCGNDTLALLEAGWEVQAIDAQAEAIARTIEKAAAAKQGARLHAVVCPFEELIVAPSSFDLIYASFSLPFCERDRFNEFWGLLMRGLKPGGMIAGQLFGDRDEWANEAGHLAQVFLTLNDFDELTQGLERLHFEEVERDGETATKRQKHWHVYHFILRQTS